MVLVLGRSRRPLAWVVWVLVLVLQLADHRGCMVLGNMGNKEIGNWHRLVVGNSNLGCKLNCM